MNSKVIITLFIAFIMVTSIIGFIWSSESTNNNYEVLEYNNYEFKKINGKYLLENGKDYEYVFDYSPYELSNVNFQDFNLESDKYYVIFNPDEKDLNMEYSMQKLFLVLRGLGVNVQLACYKEEGCNENLPIKNCNDHAFYFNKMDESRVYNEGKCVVIEGDNEGISKGVDLVNLNILGVK